MKSQAFIRFIVVLFLLCGCISKSYAQQYLFGMWTDGFYQFYANSMENGQIQFIGGNLHEGGTMFYGKFIADTIIKIKGRVPEYDDEPDFGSLNDFFEYKKVGNHELLVLLDSKKVVKSVLQKFNIPLKDFVITNKINHQLAGEFRKLGSSDIIQFLPNQSKVLGLKEITNYEFAFEFDFPIDVIKLGSEYYWYEKEDNTLNFYHSHLNQYDEFQKGEFLMKLKLVKSLNIVDDLQGDYTFASTIPLINGILSYYNTEELRLMRNEIFARYGYKFKSQKLKIHFKSKSWYNPKYGSVTSKLTQLEKLNIQLIKNAEQRKKLD